MTEDDILSLRSGFPALLPKTKTGKYVIYADRRQKVESVSFTVRIRSLFYLAHVISEDEVAQAEGCYWVILVAAPNRLLPINPPAFKIVARFLAETAPIKVDIHLLNYSPISGGAHTKRFHEVQDVITSFLVSLLEQGFQSDTPNVHFEREEGQLFGILRGLGLTKESIPTALGGWWTSEIFRTWCQSRAEEDRGQLKEDVSSEAANSGLTKKKRKPTGPVEKESKKRTRNIIYSRQRRARQLHEFEELQEKHGQMTKENKMLATEQIRLKELMKQAKEYIP
eukprot:CAMPEP_0198141392 /NCGR_PEP_ID=MMETSP1443-20131203/4409_1 /TAXON_ID=186043 /ORGANISM="Entomoneis sp., Strain CCMP2396" /LENGTH=281 /DNA_ID=CAMNT_0043804131 /DNA_START=92 /DNA_END=937 /DNA_ORIENTATION=-